MSSKVAAALAVDKGAKQLDHYFPDWAEVIDTSSFAIDDSDTCILAQLYPETELFSAKLKKIGLRTRECMDYGFDLLYPFDKAPFSYTDLQDVWLAQIKSRTV